MTTPIASRYYRFSDFLKSRYGGRVQRVSVDAGFSCPNLDGFLSTDGCIYCNNKSFGKNDFSIPIEEQIRSGIAAARKRHSTEKFILYFQSFSNTYGKTEELKEIYDTVLNYPEFVCLCVGTRPDCIDEERTKLLVSYKDKLDVWVELGLQSANDTTLKAINRGHDFNCFNKAVKILNNNKIEVFAHIILGLPGEGINEMKQTAAALSDLPVSGVKIHPLHIVKGTTLETLFNKGGYQPMTIENYIDYLILFLEHLRKDIVIVRATADVLGNLLIAPEWIKDKNRMLRMLDDEMEKRNSFQGMQF
jgi:radical SAM protein (TIGR01212 family)